MYFTADTHFKHGNIIKYCNRPFSSVEEMDETIIENWNKVIKPDDIVYHLGDFMFARGFDATNQIRRYASRLNGKIHLLLGNHDMKLIKNLYDSKAFESIHKLLEIRHQNQKITLCHYAMRVWNCAHHGAWQLYGHSHSTLPDIGGLQIDVGVDCFNFTPIHFDEIKAIMNKRNPFIQHSNDHHMQQLEER